MGHLSNGKECGPALLRIRFTFSRHWLTICGVSPMIANLNLSLLQAARVASAQHLLFPNTPRGVCDEVGLNWWAAIKLYDDGWLSFAPEVVSRLDESQEAELRFVGALVVAGCDRPMLAALLSGLPKPYAYHGSRLYYDW